MSGVTVFTYGDGDIKFDSILSPGSRCVCVFECMKAVTSGVLNPLRQWKKKGHTSGNLTVNRMLKSRLGTITANHHTYPAILK